MISWLMAVALAGADCSDTAKADEAATELKALYEADKADNEAQVDKLDKANDKRVKAALKLVDLACTPEAKMHAGMLLYRSKEPALLERAYELGKAAMMEHVYEGPWLTAVSFDRWQVSQHQPQRYATQMSAIEGKGVCLWAVAEDSTDDERKQYGLPPIADAYRRVLDANGFTKEPATAAAVGTKHLWCDPSQW